METEWLKLRSEGSAKFVNVPFIEKWQRRSILATPFNDVNFLTLAGSTKKHNGLTALIVRTGVADDPLIATTEYLFVRDIQKMLHTITTFGLVDTSYCYPSFNYYALEIKDGLSSLDLQDLILGYTQKKAKSYRGNARVKEMFLNTALYSPTEPFWYLAKTNFKGDVLIEKII